MRRFIAGAAVLLGSGPAWAQGDDSALVARARAIHERVMTLDTHVDISSANFTTERNYTQRLATQVNLPKMEEGGLDAVFLIVYVGQRQDFTPDGYARAHSAALDKFQAIHRLAEEIAPGRIGLATTAEEARRIYASGRKVALIGVENGYPIGADITNVRKFYDLGGRYMSLAHNGHSQLSDSNTGERDGIWEHNGLSPLGRQVIAEMNRLGMMVDISHPSKQSMMQTLELSRAPIIASHSAVRALCNHSRNLDDEQLQGLKKNGGVAQLVAFNSYVKCPPELPGRAQAIAGLRQEFGLPTGPGGGGGGGLQSLSEEKRAEFQQRMQEINQRFPAPPRATVRDFVDHIDYAVKLIGLDHVGLSSDFDGGGGVEGWSDATETLNVTLELVRRGYTEEQIGKLWSGNLLRVMEETDRIGRELRGGGAGAVPMPAALSAQDRDYRNLQWWHPIVASGGIAALFLIDKPVRNFIQDNRSATLDDIASVAVKFHEAEVPLVTGAGALVLGLATGDRKIAQTGIQVLGSFGLVSAAVIGTKWVFGRARPSSVPLDPTSFRMFDGTNASAFPSTAAGVTFSVATTLADAIDHPAATVVLYTGATLNSWSRLNGDRHWLSDVALGALYGITSAKIVNGKWRFFGLKPPTVIVDGRGGAALAYQVGF